MTPKSDSTPRDTSPPQETTSQTIIMNNNTHPSNQERIQEILQKAKQEAGLSLSCNPMEIEGLLVPQGSRSGSGSGCEGTVKEGVTTTTSDGDDASSITFGKNWIRLDDLQLDNQLTGKKKKSSLSRPIKLSEIENKLFKNYVSNSLSYSELYKHQLVSKKSSSLLNNNNNHLTSGTSSKIKETNFDKLDEIKQRQLGYSTCIISKKSDKGRHGPMDWHDLPVQELTKEVKMEIQAMRLHRTLDPKSFIKGGIEKACKEPIPNKFLFGYVTGGDGSTEGSINKSSSFKKRVESLLQDEKSQEWSKKKYKQVQASGQSGKQYKKSFKKLR